MIYAKVIKHGKSLGIIFPVEVCRALDMRRADYVSIFVHEAGFIVLKKVVEELELPIIKID